LFVLIVIADNLEGKEEEEDGNHTSEYIFFNEKSKKINNNQF
jgi:hypothetical protein